MACSAEFTAKSGSQRYCSKNCRESPRFYGRHCEVCDGKIYSSRGAQKTQETCSKSCAMILRGSALNPSFNDRYFEEPNPENSYWAGFIAADGCISDRRQEAHQQRLTIGLSSKDREHLVDFSKSIGGGGVKTYEYERSLFGNAPKIYSTAVWSKSSDKICDDLRTNFNITPRKTLTLKPPRNLSDENSIAFIAGYIDGDGCYYNGNRGLVIKILGTIDLLNWVSEVLGLPLNSKKVEGSEVYVKWISGSRAGEVQSHIRSLGLPLLSRKHL